MSNESFRETLYVAAGWVFLVLMGPLHFGGEMVGPAGGTSWRQWACALLGSLLWGAVALWVIGNV